MTNPFIIAAPPGSLGVGAEGAIRFFTETRVDREAIEGACAVRAVFKMLGCSEPSIRHVAGNLQRLESNFRRGRVSPEQFRAAVIDILRGHGRLYEQGAARLSVVSGSTRFAQNPHAAIRALQPAWRPAEKRQLLENNAILDFVKAEVLAAQTDKKRFSKIWQLMMDSTFWEEMRQRRPETGPEETLDTRALILSGKVFSYDRLLALAAWRTGEAGYIRTLVQRTAESQTAIEILVQFAGFGLRGAAEAIPGLTLDVYADSLSVRVLQGLYRFGSQRAGRKLDRFLGKPPYQWEREWKNDRANGKFPERLFKLPELVSLIRSAYAIIYDPHFLWRATPAKEAVLKVLQGLRRGAPDKAVEDTVVLLMETMQRGETHYSHIVEHFQRALQRETWSFVNPVQEQRTLKRVDALQRKLMAAQQQGRDVTDILERLYLFRNDFRMIPLPERILEALEAENEASHHYRR